MSVTTSIINKCLPVLIDGAGYILSAAWREPGGTPPPHPTTATNTSLTHRSFSLSLPFIITTAGLLDFSLSVSWRKQSHSHVSRRQNHPKPPE